jgi:hypothetical protein
VRQAFAQPVPHHADERARQPGSSVARSQKHSSKRRLDRVTIWVEREVKAEVDRIARQEGLSVSATGAAFLREAVRQKLHVQHAVLRAGHQEADGHAEHPAGLAPGAGRL